MDNQRKKEKKRSPTIIKKIPKEIKNRISQNSIYIYIFLYQSLFLFLRETSYFYIRYKCQYRYARPRKCSSPCNNKFKRFPIY